MDFECKNCGRKTHASDPYDRDTPQWKACQIIEYSEKCDRCSGLPSRIAKIDAAIERAKELIKEYEGRFIL